jgi:hypothetical protein
MEQAREILIQYAQADFFKRIYLFLQFPGLRDAFQEIERIILSRAKSLPIFDCTTEKTEIFWASLVPQSNYRYEEKEIEKI